MHACMYMYVVCITRDACMHVHVCCMYHSWPFFETMYCPPKPSDEHVCCMYHSWPFFETMYSPPKPSDEHVCCMYHSWPFFKTMYSPPKPSDEHVCCMYHSWAFFETMYPHLNRLVTRQCLIPRCSNQRNSLPDSILAKTNYKAFRRALEAQIVDPRL